MCTHRCHRIFKCSDLWLRRRKKDSTHSYSIRNLLQTSAMAQTVSTAFFNIHQHEGNRSKKNSKNTTPIHALTIAGNNKKSFGFIYTWLCVIIKVLWSLQSSRSFEQGMLNCCEMSRIRNKKKLKAARFEGVHVETFVFQHQGNTLILLPYSKNKKHSEVQKRSTINRHLAAGH